MASWKTCLRWTFVLLAPLAILLAIEGVARLSFGNAARWMLLRDDYNPIRFSYLWLFLLVVLCFALTNKLRWSLALCFALPVGLAVISSGKQLLLQQPIVPGDFHLIWMSRGVWSSSYFPFSWSQSAIFVAICASWGFACFKFAPDVRLTASRRIAAGLIATVMWCALTMNPREFSVHETPISNKLTVRWKAEDNVNSSKACDSGCQNPDFSTAFNYLSLGLLPGFLVCLEDSTSTGNSLPVAYSPESIRKAWQGQFEPKPFGANATVANRPHVIVILSEAFWDPTWLEGARISSDPLPSFRKLAQGSNACSVVTVSPVYGGYTCKAEFEVLTGMAMAMFPEDTVPHRNQFKAHVPSLPSVFKAIGYDTIAIHPFLADFWNRNLVYPQIGFDRFTHLDKMRHKTVKGKFVSDDALADEILDTLAEAKKPTFVFAVSMQNHSPYNDSRYGEVECDTVTVESPTVNAAMVREYVHGIRDADAMLEKLTQRLSKSDQPVLLVIAGDHQPNLIPMEAPSGSFTQSVRKDAGFPGLPFGQQYLGIGLFWSNRHKPEEPGSPLSLAALPSWILREAQVEMPPFFRLSEQVFAAYPVIHKAFGMDAQASTFPVRGRLNDPLLQSYKMITHDLLLGKNYSAQTLEFLIAESQNAGRDQTVSRN